MTICEFTIGYVDCYKELLETTPLAMHKELYRKCKICEAKRCKMWPNGIGKYIHQNIIEDTELMILKNLGFE